MYLSHMTYLMSHVTSLNNIYRFATQWIVVNGKPCPQSNSWHNLLQKMIVNAFSKPKKVIFFGLLWQFHTKKKKLFLLFFKLFQPINKSAKLIQTCSLSFLSILLLLLLEGKDYEFYIYMLNNEKLSCCYYYLIYYCHLNFNVWAIKE